MQNRNAAYLRENPEEIKAHAGRSHFDLFWVLI